MMKRIIRIHFAITLLLLAVSLHDVSAQCSVCRAGAESSVEAKKNPVGKGLNKGILYLMSIPYVLGGVAFYIWKKNKTKE